MSALHFGFILGMIEPQPAVEPVYYQMPLAYRYLPTQQRLRCQLGSMTRRMVERFQTLLLLYHCARPVIRWAT